jgi:hypothetical protein
MVAIAPEAEAIEVTDSTSLAADSVTLAMVLEAEAMMAEALALMLEAAAEMDELDDPVPVVAAPTS